MIPGFLIVESESASDSIYPVVIAESFVAVATSFAGYSVLVFECFDYSGYRCSYPSGHSEVESRNRRSQGQKGSKKRFARCGGLQMGLGVVL